MLVTAVLNERVKYFQVKRKSGTEPTPADGGSAPSTTAPQSMEMSKYAVGDVQAVDNVARKNSVVQPIV